MAEETLCESRRDTANEQKRRKKKNYPEVITNWSGNNNNTVDLSNELHVLAGNMWSEYMYFTERTYICIYDA